MLLNYAMEFEVLSIIDLQTKAQCPTDGSRLTAKSCIEMNAPREAKKKQTQGDLAKDMDNGERAKERGLALETARRWVEGRQEWKPHVPFWALWVLREGERVEGTKNQRKCIIISDSRSKIRAIAFLKNPFCNSCEQQQRL